MSLKFKIGDKVSVIDEAISGYIVSLNESSASIMTSDGFELTFTLNNLVKEAQNKLEEALFSRASIQTVLKDKESTKRPQTKVKKAKERYEPTMEVDLHIHQLTKSNKHMTKHDMLNIQLDTAKHKLEFAMRKRIQKIVFIHGVGEGVLKLELQYLFDRYSNVKHYDANYQKYGLGATEVYIYQNTNP